MMSKAANFFLMPISLVLLLVKLTGCALFELPLSTHSNQPSNSTPEPAPQTVSPIPTPTPRVRQKPVGITKPLFSPDSDGYLTQGYASWYQLSAHGAKTTSGQIYDLYGMTAAHATLPLWTQVEVKNLQTGHTVMVTINDRLENSRFLIKLSYWAARHLGLVKTPSQLVEVRGLPSQ